MSTAAGRLPLFAPEAGLVVQGEVDSVAVQAIHFAATATRAGTISVGAGGGIAAAMTSTAALSIWLHSAPTRSI